MSDEEIAEATKDQESSLYWFLNREPELFYRGRFQAVAHVLAERSLLTWAGCKPGIVSVER